MSPSELAALQLPFDLTIRRVHAIDLRFPTSREHIGSDAVNLDPDYSVAYCILETDTALRGFGLTFTLGRGTELCVLALEYLARFVEGRHLSEIVTSFGSFVRELTGDTQFRWLGPEKGVIHLAAAALLNAVWDLYARVAGKPLWQLLADMPAAQLVDSVDFTYITDAITPAEAQHLLATSAPTAAGRLALLRDRGYPAYTTSPGWMGLSDDHMRRLCREAVAGGWTHIKLKVGATPETTIAAPPSCARPLAPASAS